MKKMIRSIVYGALVMGLFSSCLQTPVLEEGQASSDFSDSNSNPNIDPSTGLPYVNQPSIPKDSESPSLSSGSAPTKSGKAPEKNESGKVPEKSGAKHAEALQKEIDEQNAKDMALYEAKQKELAEPKEKDKEKGNASGKAPAKEPEPVKVEVKKGKFKG